MLKYDIFYRNNVVRRISQFTETFKLSDQKELPSGSILHMIDNIASLNTDAPVSPNDQNPFYQLLPDKKVILNVRSFGIDTPLIEPDLKGIIPLSMGVSQELKEFRAAHSSTVRYATSPEELPERSTIQAILNYNPLIRSRITGRFPRLRMYRAIVSTVMNMIAKIPNRDHIVHLPMSDLVFTKPDFIKAFVEQTKVSVKYPEVSHYLIMMDILCYIEADSKEGIFNKVPEDILNRVTFALTNGDKLIYYRLDTLKELNGSGNSSLIRVIKHMNSLSNEQVVLDEPIEEVVINEDIVKVKLSEDKPANVTGVKGAPIKEFLEESTKEYIASVETTADVKIDEDVSLTPAQKERAKKLARKWKEIDVEGVPLEKIVTSFNDQTIEDNTLSIFKGDIPDTTMAQSTVANMNSSYMKKMFAKDLMTNLVSFNSQGMFLTNMKYRDTSDEFNEQVEYTANFEDASGKTHVIKFTIPKVNENGQCLVNGNLKVMRMQRVNTPIVKISPTRVSLNSYAGKQLVERNTAKAHSFYESFKRALDKAETGTYSFTGDSTKYENQTLPYDYTEIAEHHTSLTTKDFTWVFSYKNRFINLNDTALQMVASKEQKYGVFFGTGGTTGEIAYFIDMQSKVTKLDIRAKAVLGVTTILDEVVNTLGVKVPQFTEWVDLSVLNKKVPVIFALCYRFGFSKLLNYLNVNYTTYEPNERITVSTTDMVLKFNDKKLVIKGTPKHIGLLYGGFDKFDLSDISIEEMDSKDIYFDLVTNLKLSINYLRGLDTMFDSFIDPITRDVLTQMNEPTNMKDLLIRATSLLTTTDHLEPAASANHRFRTYERMTGIVYNKINKALSDYKNSGATNKSFSISPYEVSQAIITDPLLRNVETLNPITAAKEMCGATHIGEGGRSAETFVVKDRQYTKDNIGIISESTVDSGKVGVDLILSVNPTMTSVRGLTETKPISELDPSNVLSSTALLMPFATSDDSKRAMKYGSTNVKALV